ncbi:MAG: hypothetical protein MUE91_12870 [Ignavibacteriaceae bacterium]|nr:hypothetical protein [Ignavibacteriaceae bacterium]
MAKKVEKKSVKKTTTKKPLAKKTAPKKAQKKAAAKKPVKKAMPTKKTTAKSSSVKKEARPIRKAVKAFSAKRAKASKVQVEVKFEDLVESRNKAIQKIKGYSKRDLDQFKQIILEKRDEIIEQLQNLKEQMLDPTTGEYINEN